MDHAAGIVVVQADQPGGVFDGQPIGNQGEELPTSCLNRGWRPTGAVGQLLGRDMGVEGEVSCHATA